MFILGLFKVVISILMIYLTLKLMFTISPTIIDYFSSIREIGLDKECHTEYIKIIGLFFVNFIILKKGVNYLFNSNYDSCFGFIHNDVILSVLLLIESIILVFLLSKFNKHILEAFKF